MSYMSHPGVAYTREREERERTSARQKRGKETKRETDKTERGTDGRRNEAILRGLPPSLPPSTHLSAMSRRNGWHLCTILRIALYQYCINYTMA